MGSSRGQDRERTREDTLCSLPGQCHDNDKTVG